MSEAVISAVITGGISLAGIIVTVVLSNHKMMEQLDKQSQLADARLEKAQAITDTKLDELTREVREHNGFAKRMPVLEEQIKVANHRIEDLEKLAAK